VISISEKNRAHRAVDHLRRQLPHVDWNDLFAASFLELELPGDFDAEVALFSLDPYGPRQRSHEIEGALGRLSP
jgi:hypothetical protein